MLLLTPIMASSEQLLVELKELRSALANKDQLFVEKELEFSRERDKLNNTIAELTQNIAALTAQVQSLICDNKPVKKRKNNHAVSTTSALLKIKPPIWVSRKIVSLLPKTLKNIFHHPLRCLLNTTPLMAMTFLLSILFAMIF